MTEIRDDVPIFQQHLRKRLERSRLFQFGQRLLQSRIQRLAGGLSRDALRQRGFGAYALQAAIVQELMDEGLLLA